MSIHESPEAQLDRESLSHLYYSTGGQRWTRSTNWLSPAPLGSWFGVKTDSYGRVVELNLSGNGLRDNLSPKIRNLTKLTCLNLSNNYLGEPVAGSKRAWNGVLMLFLGHNRRVARSEGLPQELGSITDLHVLDLSHNSYRWEIPSTLGNLTRLRMLDLSNNRITGGIPEELGNLTELRVLNLSYNRLYGEIPASLSNLTNLERTEFGPQETPGYY